MNRKFRLGFVEGFYGRPWSWSERSETADFLAEAGYRFYLYAPKGDLFLRRRWRESWPEATLSELSALIDRFHRHGIRIGVGLSPHEFHFDDGGEDLRLLMKRVAEISRLGIDHLALLFDDMKGDVPELASKQIRLAHAVMERWSGRELSLCPSYYSFDPILDRLFGVRPEGYLETLGNELDSSIEIFWTGEKICSTHYTLEHLQEVKNLLKRLPLLWDNYPVNDTERLSKHLHLKAVTGRPAILSELLSGHLVNPMLQPRLSRIPALTLAESYRRGEAYIPETAFVDALRSVAGKEVAEEIFSDVSLFQEEGLDQISSDLKIALIRKYSTHDLPASNEIVGWLKGEYAVNRDLILSQQ